MHFNRAQEYITRDQAVRMGKASQKVQALKRLAAAADDVAPINSGLQYAIIVVDFRCAEPAEKTVLLFEAGMKNRYRHMMNFEKQRGLISVSAAHRSLSRR